MEHSKKQNLLTLESYLSNQQTNQLNNQPTNQPINQPQTHNNNKKIQTFSTRTRSIQGVFTT